MRIVLPPFDKCNGHIVNVGQITTHPFSLILPTCRTAPTVLLRVEGMLRTSLSAGRRRATLIRQAAPSPRAKAAIGWRGAVAVVWHTVWAAPMHESTHTTATRHAPRIAPMVALARGLGAACRISVARLRPAESDVRGMSSTRSKMVGAVRQVRGGAEAGFWVVC